MRLTAKRLARIPHAPGVYMFTKRGVPIYIGKAADLRARLAAYTPGKDWKTDMLRAATGLRVETTASELEALLLEVNQIQAYHPTYNIANRDQKSFLSILVTTDEEFPQVLPTRSHARAGTYFGPFTSAHAVRETLRALRKIFPYRCKTKPQADSRKPQVPHPPALPLPEGGGETKKYFSPSFRGGARGGGARVLRPCLYFHLGQCAGTCAGLVTPEEYRRRVVAPLLRILRGQAKAARKMLDEEHRRLLDDVLAHTRVLSVTEKYAADLHDLQRVLHLPKLPHRIEGYDISNIHGLEAVGSMVVAIDGEPAPSEYKKFKIKTLEGSANDVGMLREVMTRRLAHSLSLRGSRATEAISAVRSPSAEIATPRPGSARNDTGEKDLWPNPDLMLIDGGKAQLNAVIRVMRAYGITVTNSSPNRHSDYSEHSDGIRNIRIALVSLAKRDEEIYLPGERHPLRLPKNAPALHLLQRVRDEAHRFAIGYHRARYRKRMFRR